ncbi:MAG: CinA family protein [Granulosicoccaceae bacterium]
MTNHNERAFALATKLGDLLIQHQYRITTAESCTGGLLATCLTDVPGASSWFEQSWVTYSNQAKIDRIGVSAETIRQYGAVSEQTVLEMANGARQIAAANIAVAISGVAGPDGGTADKPVGTVWIGWSLDDQFQDAEVAVFEGNRQQVRQAALLAALSGSIIRVSNLAD